MKWQTAIVVLPTEETLDRLRSIMSSAPIHIEFELINVVLASTLRKQVSWVADPSIEYEASFSSVSLVYDEYLGYTQLIGSLYSPMMSARMNDLQPLVEMKDPQLIFNSSGTTHSRTSKSFIASVANTLVAREDQLFTFHNEVIISRK